jgi:hypothetical protein
MKKSNARSKVAAGRESDAIYDDIESAGLTERPNLNLAVACMLLPLEPASHLHEARARSISKTVGLHIGKLHVLPELRRSGKTL